MLTSSVKTQFKPCRIYTANLDVTKKWYVYYDFLIPGTQNAWKRFKLIHDINKIRNREDRLSEANNLKKFMNEKLHAGYNPYYMQNDIHHIAKAFLILDHSSRSNSRLPSRALVM